MNMSRIASPALAFYLKHPADFSALCYLEDKPDVNAEDWQKFLDVVDKACDQAADLVIACREEALKLFAARFNVASRMSLKKVQEDWYAYGELTPKSAKSLKIYLGCALDADHAGVPFLIPYLAPGRTESIADLRTRVRNVDSSLDLPTAEWLEGYTCVVLCLIPLTPHADLDEAVAACVKPFVKLAQTL
jgi:hypothetical protein